ncbi:dtdp-4-dehydrorhamnose reductase [Heliomicrobium modesticaldum Ice1]|uniref:dTDP-4-dehydrorhamnose reductase n=1 Tax=Heliobacterium modesticaldum (strain ATCC 51547 / Ice1) TaxID=498761 RepID=B0THG1_HELMI|nr:dTDP-4-dehydrorhamnose reductase [Heliomicrobium modesticaldum]ABZ83399.1 dtdp-4-dehydrorhamnose reductase [Heliomicrobium modesticaldum Ice1]
MLNQTVEKKLTLLITGANGQVAYDLLRRLPSHYHWVALGSNELDIRDSQQVHQRIRQIWPDWVVNLAAYTKVDLAEKEAETAYAVNMRGVEHLARALAAQRAATGKGWLLHVSTDFVFDGCHSSPYHPEHPISPKSVYGDSKAKGEALVREWLPEAHIILRTAWVYGVHGHNFVKTILRLMSEREEVRVVADQVGTPTWSGALADVILSIIRQVVDRQKCQSLAGTYHFTDAGAVSWYDFAVAIAEEAAAMGYPVRAKVLPIRTVDYPTPAQRPAYSVLDKTDTWRIFSIQPVHWREHLRKMLGEFCKRYA